jgi:hypothetical protein
LSSTAPRSRELIPDLIAAAGVVVAFAFGTAGGFEHTVTLAHRNGAGDHWDIVTAVCVEVLAVTGTAMWVSFNRRGWPTHWPLALVVLGVLMTFGAQIAYRAAPLPNAALGYVVVGTPTTVALLLILVAHLAHGYAATHSATARSEAPAPEVGATLLPEVLAPEVPDLLVPVAEIPEPLAAPEYVPDPLPIPAPAKTDVVQTPSTEHRKQLDQVRELEVSKTTGKPTIATVRAHFGIGQAKATKLINEAYPEADSAAGEEQNEDRNQSVGKEEAEEARGENELSHPCNSVDQGLEPPTDASEDGLLRLVRGA